MTEELRANCEVSAMYGETICAKAILAVAGKTKYPTAIIVPVDALHAHARQQVMESDF